MKAFLIILTFFIGLPIFADEVRSPQAENDRDEEVALRAKRKIYPGGPDEGELRVQDPLPVPTRKISPVIQEPEDETNSAE